MPRIYHRLVLRLPGTQSLDWQQVLAGKKRELAAPWHDTRPLILFAGDSEIEFGSWYDLFAGAWAARNGGLARAKITDVTQLVSAVGDPHPKIVVLMCGINNLGDGGERDACLRDYETLLNAVGSHLQPKFTVVLSVMPVRESAVDHRVHQFNLNIIQFNAGLATCCRRHQVEFLDVNSVVAGANGGLAENLTPDGLHLNLEGYRRLAQVITPQLTSMMGTP